MIELNKGIRYVVRFENGKFFRHSSFLSSFENETDELEHASKYDFDWQPLKDLYLQMYVENTLMKYELVKVKTQYEIVQ